MRKQQKKESERTKGKGGEEEERKEGEKMMNILIIFTKCSMDKNTHGVFPLRPNRLHGRWCEGIGRGFWCKNKHQILIV